MGPARQPGQRAATRPAGLGSMRIHISPRPKACDSCDPGCTLLRQGLRQLLRRLALPGVRRQFSRNLRHILAVTTVTRYEWYEYVAASPMELAGLPNDRTLNGPLQTLSRVNCLQVHVGSRVAWCFTSMGQCPAGGFEAMSCVQRFGQKSNEARTMNRSALNHSGPAQASSSCLSASAVCCKLLCLNPTFCQGLEHESFLNFTSSCCFQDWQCSTGLRVLAARFVRLAPRLVHSPLFAPYTQDNIFLRHV